MLLHFILATVLLAQAQVHPANHRIELRTREATISVKADGSDQKDLKHVATPVLSSPDGKRKAYVAREGREWYLYVADADGGNVQRLRENRYDYLMDVQWSGDSQWVLTVGHVNGKQQAMRYKADGSERTPLTDEPEGIRLARFGPKGEVSYVVPRGREGKLERVDLIVRRNGAKKTVVSNDYVRDHAWSPTGQLAVALIEAVEVHDLARGEKVTVKYATISDKLYAHAAHDIDWRPDGQALLCRITFLGGRAVSPGGKAPEIFGDHEVFIIPVTGKPSYFLPSLQDARARWIAE